MIKKILFGLLGILVIFILGFVVWGSIPLGPMPEAVSALNSDSKVQITRSDWYEFLPTNIKTPTMGVIVYPGGRVDVRSYAPLARRIAELGYPVYLVPMPLSLAVLDVNAAQKVIAAHPEFSTWVIGGHSLGGVMAASFAKKHLDVVKGLFFLASYPVESDDFSQATIKVTSIYGTEDGQAGQMQNDLHSSLLPKDTIWVKIEGGNHAQMGWYGLQPGDGIAAISRDDQQRIVLESLDTFLKIIPK